jgi:hypothetical protein
MVLPKGFKARAGPGKGGYLVTLDRQVVDRLAAMRGPVVCLAETGS